MTNGDPFVRNIVAQDGTATDCDHITLMDRIPSIRRVGLLGGSFNPAHAGHRYISLAGLQLLGLDEVWWLVSPQNPLKGTSDMAPMADRIASARDVARHRQIRVTGIEAELGTVYTVDTVAALQERFPALRFVWFMGADNMVQVPRWKGWRELFARVPIAVFPRPSYSHRALSEQAALDYAEAQVPASQAQELAELDPPAWVFLPTRPHAASATRIRAEQGAGRGHRARFGGIAAEVPAEPAKFNR